MSTCEPPCAHKPWEKINCGKRYNEYHKHHTVHRRSCLAWDENTTTKPSIRVLSCLAGVLLTSNQRKQGGAARKYSTLMAGGIVNIT